MPSPRIIANFIFFQTAWFAGILLPPGWASASVIVILAIHLAVIALPREWRLILLCMLIGGVWDTLLSVLGFYAFNPDATFWTPAVIPLWLLLMWANFATVLCHSLRWLADYPKAAALIGGIAGPAAYLGGAAITDKLAFTGSVPLFFLISAPFWAALCGLLPKRARRIAAAKDEPSANTN